MGDRAERHEGTEKDERSNRQEKMKTFEETLLKRKNRFQVTKIKNDQLIIFESKQRDFKRVF